MADSKTVRMLNAYYETTPAMGFLSSMFQSPPSNFHSSEEVNVDIVRGEEHVAPVMTEVDAGYNLNTVDVYTSKEITPPIFKEAVQINAGSLLKRSPDQNPFMDVGARAEIIRRSLEGVRKIQAKIARSVERQAAGIFNAGIISLENSKGETAFTVNYNAKASHIPVIGTPWDDPSATPIQDLAALAEVVRRDGKNNPDRLIFGAKAWEAFTTNDEVKSRLDLRRGDFGALVPLRRDQNGGVYQGTVEIGSYRVDCYTYPAFYLNPSDSLALPYVPEGYVYMMCSTGRLDATYGSVPNFNQALGRQSILPEITGRFSSPDRGMDMFVNAWTANDGSQLFVGVAARPLLIPTAIDTIARLDTGV